MMGYQSDRTSKLYLPCTAVSNPTGEKKSSAGSSRVDKDVQDEPSGLRC